MKDKEGGTTEEESKQTTDKTTENEKEMKEGPRAERVIAALEDKLRESRRRHRWQL